MLLNVVKVTMQYMLPLNLILMFYFTQVSQYLVQKGILEIYAKGFFDEVIIYIHIKYDT